MGRPVVINNNAWVPLEVLEQANLLTSVKNDLELVNLTAIRAKNFGGRGMGDSNPAPERFVLWEEFRGRYLIIPRGYFFSTLKARLEKSGPLEVRQREASTRPPSDGFPCLIKLRPRQIPAYEALVENGGGVIQLACGLGKTSVALKYAADRGLPTLVIVNTNVLLDQWRREILEETAHPKFFPQLVPGDVGIIQQDLCEFEGKTFVLAMIHTLAKKKYSADLYKYFGTIIIDEIHNTSAVFFNKVVDKFWGVRVGLSASAKREDGMDPMFTHHVGPIIYKDLKQELLPQTYFIESGLTWDRLAPNDGRRNPGRSDFILWSKSYSGTWVNTGKTNFAKLVTRICEDPDFNESILAHIGLAAETGRKVLVLGERVAQLEWFQKQWSERSKITSGLVIGAKKNIERRQALDSQVVFATAKLAEEGLDCPSFDSLFIIIPKSPIRFIQQAVGRILRVKAGKADPIVIIFSYEKLSCHEMDYVYKKTKANLKELNFPFQKGE